MNQGYCEDAACDRYKDVIIAMVQQAMRDVYKENKGLRQALKEGDATSEIFHKRNLARLRVELERHCDWLDGIDAGKIFEAACNRKIKTRYGTEKEA